MQRWSVLATIVGVAAVAIAWREASAQPGGAPLDPANFTGKVVASATDDIRTLRLTFEPGARTNWHSHAGGQTLIVEKGRLRAMERGGRGKEFGPAETYLTAPGVVHWHGALPSAPLTQIAVSFGATTWLEKVTDAQYNEAARK
jgi:quercetin dioxygenase-like cupin family protein